MKSLKLTLSRDGDQRYLSDVDIAVRADPGATVGALAHALATRDPAGAKPVPGYGLTLRVDGAPQPIPPETPVERSGLRSGVTVRLSSEQPSGARMPVPADAAVLHVRKGPDAVTMPEVRLRRGEHTIGRSADCHVVLSDPAASTHHAKIIVGDVVEIIDTNSTNGVVVGGGLVSRARLRAGDTALIGDTVISVSLFHPGQGGPDENTRPDGADGSEVAFNRSPRLDPTYPGTEHRVPPVPQRPNARRFPIIPMVAPLVIGAALYLITGSIFGLVFIVLSPMMVIGTYLEDAMGNRRALKVATTEFKTELAKLNSQLYAARVAERDQRQREHPALDELVEAALRLGPLLWTRRPEHERFLDLGLGLGTLPSRDTVELPSRDKTVAALWHEMLGIVTPYERVAEVPVVARLTECGALGVAGPPARMTAVAAGLVAQLVALHSPAELVLTAVMSAESAARWRWLTWLPHTDSAHTPLRCDHLTMGGAATANLIAEIDDLIDRRREKKAEGRLLPMVVLLVDDDTDADRTRLVDIAERGRENGVYVVWVAGRVTRLPAVCRTFVEVDPETGGGLAGFVHVGQEVSPVQLEPLDAETANRMARRLAPVVDAGARAEDDGSLPRSVSFVSMMESALHEDVGAVVERWRDSGSLGHTDPASARDGRAGRLRALVGTTGNGVDEGFWLDLREHGPHALVGGTTGAGKSELLQTWILSLAASYSPQRVTFLLVDYKGGSAFGECSALPHSVGLVTDLSQRLVHRALTSLRAELTYREKELNKLGAKDLDALEGTPHAGALPRLVIVVDEFAALKKEIPEFVDGVVDVAQRGRSLGLHLILATQRPAGVITESLRANTNLRVALRMADETDSTDVLGIPLAAGFDPAIPGRAVAKTGPGRLATFQTAYVGGWTSTAPAPQVAIQSLAFGPGEVWPVPPAPDSGPGAQRGDKDITRIVATVTGAFEWARRHTGLTEPRPPWLEELPGHLDLTPLLARSRREEPVARPGVAAPAVPLVIGQLDLPKSQSQPLASFRPDDGHLVVYGAGGSGKSTVLRSIAISAVHQGAGPCHLYGLDFGARGLQMLEALPHVGSIVYGEDTDRVRRLLVKLRQIIHARKVSFADVRAANIVDFWRHHGYDLDRPDWGTPRVLLLVDGIGSFYQEHQPGSISGNFENLVSIATDGRAVGVHLAVTADRSGAVPSSLVSALQTQLVLRLAGENDYRNLGLAPDAIEADAPPGRGRQIPSRSEFQIAVFGGRDQPAQHAAVVDLAARLREQVRPAPGVQTWPKWVPLTAIAANANGNPMLGIEGESLSPIDFPTAGAFVVTGPMGSARQGAIGTMCRELRRCRAGVRFCYLGKVGSPLLNWDGWSAVATDGERARALAVSAGPPSTPTVLVIESLNDFTLGMSAADPLYVWVKALLDHGQLVIAEGEANQMMTTSPLHQLVKSHRRGLVLQPQSAYSSILSVEFPRGLRQLDFPPDRGLLVVENQTTDVQVALAEPV